MKILKRVEAIPGGTMVVPLILGMLFNTFIPESLMIGSFTTAMFKDGALAFLGLFILCSSAQIRVKSIGKTIKVGGSLLLLKFVLGSFLGILVAHFWGVKGLLGITPLALVASMSNANVGVFASLAESFGTEEEVNASSIISINEGPLLTFIAFGASGVAKIPLIDFVAICVPIIVGFTLGNLDSDLREFLAKGQKLLIPFFAFPLGAALNLNVLLTSGMSGILIGLLNILITGGVTFVLFRWLFRKSLPGTISGWFIGTTAGNAVGTPAAMALISPEWEPYVEQATAQVATSVIVTAVLIPFIVSYFDKKRKGAVNAS